LQSLKACTVELIIIGDDVVGEFSEELDPGGAPGLLFPIGILYGCLERRKNIPYPD
jgi:hypothetical protein